MKLKKIKIKNYRQFTNSKINFEDGITILAGANNSGKTSLIELVKNVFGSQKCSLCIDDIPVKMVKSWVDDIYDQVIEIFIEEDEKEDKINKINKLFNNKENVEVELKNKIDGIKVYIEITYELEEDISKFSDYLMDLDESIQSFYFKFEYASDMTKLKNIIQESYEVLDKRISELNSIGEDEDKVCNKKNIIKGILAESYIKSFDTKYYFTDKDYMNKNIIEDREFKSLFNFYCIDANRLLTNDDSDRKYSISNEVVNYMSNDSEWENLIYKLPENIKSVIEETGIKEEIQEKSVHGLENVICEIAKTNGGRSADILLDFDIDNSSIESLIKNITKAKYVIEEFHLKETAQGLGYSNLILIHLKLENYLQMIDDSIVNLFIIEEPEVHMHPQMQKVFIKYLFDYYADENIQGLITTHSNEMIKTAKMKKIRVIREKILFSNEIYDMRQFLKNIDEIDSDLRKFYNLFYNINFSEIVFADRVIMYEGDTERMYIEQLLKEKEFENLNKLYIAYVQVGGAYAHRYKDLIEYLKIKTVIFTDIDYKKDCKIIAKIKDSITTNATINHFYKTDKENDNKKDNDILIKNIFNWQKEFNDRQDNIRIQFQNEKDGYSRTLEEAMFSKLLSKNCEKQIDKSKWEKIKKENGLKFSIPNTGKEYYIRDIVESTSNSKTDFMYSVIENKKTLDMLPNYIEEGLKWLME